MRSASFDMGDIVDCARFPGKQKPGSRAGRDLGETHMHAKRRASPDTSAFEEVETGGRFDQSAARKPEGVFAPVYPMVTGAAG